MDAMARLMETAIQLLGTAPTAMQPGDAHPSTVDPADPVQLIAGMRCLLRLSGVEAVPARKLRARVVRMEAEDRQVLWSELLDSFNDNDFDAVCQWAACYA